MLTSESDSLLVRWQHVQTHNPMEQTLGPEQQACNKTDILGFHYEQLEEVEKFHPSLLTLMVQDSQNSPSLRSHSFSEKPLKMFETLRFNTFNML